MTSPTPVRTPQWNAERNAKTWHPKWVVHPGEILLEALGDAQMPQAHLAEITGFTPKHINTVIKGKAHIGPQFALALEAVFGASAEFWMNLQTAYDLGVARGYVPTSSSGAES